MSASGSTITVGSNSNAYGTRYTQSTQPATLCNGDIWYDTSIGSSVVPIGSVFYFAQTSAPTGYLSCNGAAISRTTYIDLWNIIGTLYGSGDGSTTFNLPDLRGEFIRGWDNGRGVDSGRTFGSFQADELRSHSHLLSRYSANNSVNTQTEHYANACNNPYGPDSTQPWGGVETRPRNIALLPCIKY